MSAVLMVLWVCQVHVADTLALFALFFLAVCTSVFYGVLLWTVYLALEPFVDATGRESSCRGPTY